MPKTTSVPSALIVSTRAWAPVMWPRTVALWRRRRPAPARPGIEPLTTPAEVSFKRSRRDMLWPMVHSLSTEYADRNYADRGNADRKRRSENYNAAGRRGGDG